MTQTTEARSFWVTPLPRSGLVFSWICFVLGGCFGFVIGIYIGVQF